jgi:hypothetical protein
MSFEFDREKFKDAMHYVIASAGDHPGFGAIKLYKVLWFADAKNYLVKGEPITGEEYVRRQFGPVPKHALQTRTELENEGRIRVWEDRFFDRPVTRFKAKRPASTSRLAPDELTTLNYWIKHIDEDHTSTSIGDESHDYAWEIASMGETIPLFAFLASRLRDPTEDELAKARRRMGNRGRL